MTSRRILNTNLRIVLMLLHNIEVPCAYLHLIKFNIIVNYNCLFEFSIHHFSLEILVLLLLSIIVPLFEE